MEIAYQSDTQKVKTSELPLRGFVYHLTFKSMIDIIIAGMSLSDMRLISGRFVCIVANQYATDK